MRRTRYGICYSTWQGAAGQLVPGRGLMVMLHGLEHGRSDVRPTADGDVLVDIRARPRALREIVRFLSENGLQPQLAPEGIQHRLKRGTQDGEMKVDVLAPDHVGARGANRRQDGSNPAPGPRRRHAGEARGNWLARRSGAALSGSGLPASDLAEPRRARSELTPRSEPNCAHASYKVAITEHGGLSQTATPIGDMPRSNFYRRNEACKHPALPICVGHAQQPGRRAAITPSSARPGLRAHKRWTTADALSQARRCQCRAWSRSPANCQHRGRPIPVPEAS
jgi:hypothetical protein